MVSGGPRRGRACDTAPAPPRTHTRGVRTMDGVGCGGKMVAFWQPAHFPPASFTRRFFHPHHAPSIVGALLVRVRGGVGLNSLVHCNATRHIEILASC